MGISLKQSKQRSSQFLNELCLWDNVCAVEDEYKERQWSRCVVQYNNDHMKKWEVMTMQQRHQTEKYYREEDAKRSEHRRRMEFEELRQEGEIKLKKQELEKNELENERKKIEHRMKMVEQRESEAAESLRRKQEHQCSKETMKLGKKLNAQEIEILKMKEKLEKQLAIEDCD